MNSPTQLSLLAAGCQPWNFQVVAASGRRFAYCATLSVYIYQRKVSSDHYYLHSIVAEHNRCISSLSWHPTDEDIIATTSVDKSIIVWHIENQVIIAELRSLADSPVTCCFTGESLAYSTKEGPIQVWNYTEETSYCITPKGHNWISSSPVSVIKFSPCDQSKVLIGYENGTVSLVKDGCKPERGISLNSEQEEEDEDEDHEASVINIVWDPHSPDYALIVRYQMGLLMLDTNSMTVLMRYVLPSRAAYINCVAWIPGASGVFVTGDQQSGILRLWNVSKAEPLENIKIKSSNGFHALATVKKQLSANGSAAAETTPGGETSPVAHKSKSSKHTKLPSPAIYVFCTFFDGGVGLYDLQHRTWAFLREQGHIETVFDCKFSPLSATRLATASFDGSVKIWDASHTELKQVACSPGNEGALYHISWAPHDLNCLAVAARSGMFIWDVGRGRITKRFYEHGKGNRVYCVAWNQIDSRKILSGGHGFYAFVRNVDGSEVVKFEHPATVYGCEWCPSNKSLFATGCEDDKVRVFSLPSSNQNVSLVTQALRAFSGHESKAFHIRWSPLRDGYLASGSDDSTVRVWNYSDSSNSAVQVLRGHSSNVRGLCWSPEIAYLLYSGSWDYTIILWDVRTGAKLSQLRDHGVDVYGLAVHPDRPFTLASSSRDSTVRLWSTYHVAQLIPINVITQRPINEIFSTPEVAMEDGMPALLCGKASSKLHKQLSTSSETDYPQLALRIHQLCQYQVGVTNLLDLMSVVSGKPDSSLSEGYAQGIVHIKHLTQYKQSEATELDMARHTHHGGQIGAPSRHDKLQKAADLYLRLGNMQKYCELLVEGNQWEKALALAPAVSIKFWKSLLTRYTSHLLTYEPGEALAYHVAKADTEKIVSYHLQHGAYTDALTAAVVAAEGSLATPIENQQQPSQMNGATDDAKNKKLLIRTIEELSTQYLDTGYPVVAACCYLSNDMIDECVATLIRGCALELAFSVGQSLKCSPHLLSKAAELLAMRCENLNKWLMAVDLLKSVKGTERAITRLCIRSSGTTMESENIRQQAGLPKVDVATQLSQSGDVPDVEKIKLLLLSHNQAQGLKLAIGYLTRELGGRSFCLSPKFLEVLQYAQSLKPDVLIKEPVLLSDLLTISCYCGALLAIQRGYDIIVSHLLELTIRGLQADTSSSLGLIESEIKEQYQAWSHQISDSDALKTLHSRACLNDGAMNPLYGEVAVSGCTLPSFSNKSQKSLISHKVIQGPVFTLEDDITQISLGEAVMWADVNPFTPLCCATKVATAYKLNPY